MVKLKIKSDEDKKRELSISRFKIIAGGIVSVLGIFAAVASVGWLLSNGQPLWVRLLASVGGGLVLSCLCSGAYIKSSHMSEYIFPDIVDKRKKK